jgi:hypothetical protein
LLLLETVLHQGEHPDYWLLALSAEAAQNLPLRARTQTGRWATCPQVFMQGREIAREPVQFALAAWADAVCFRSLSLVQIGKLPI